VDIQVQKPHSELTTFYLMIRSPNLGFLFRLRFTLLFDTTELLLSSSFTPCLL